MNTFSYGIKFSKEFAESKLPVEFGFPSGDEFTLCVILKMSFTCFLHLVIQTKCLSTKTPFVYAIAH